MSEDPPAAASVPRDQFYCFLIFFQRMGGGALKKIPLIMFERIIDFFFLNKLIRERVKSMFFVRFFLKKAPVGNWQQQPRCKTTASRVQKNTRFFA